MMRSAMEKSIEIMLLQLIGAVIVCGLSVAGTGSASSIMNNSLNPISPLTSGSILSSSTAPSMLETYLQTFPINEQQNILTTVYHHTPARHQTSTMGVEKEKLTTSSASSSYSSTTHIATEASQQLFSLQQNTQTPFLISTGSSTSASFPTTTGNLSENPENPILVSAGPILLGCGPNNREGIGIQKALDWLREKRVTDFGWENDTHMVILAKEVSMLHSNSKLIYRPTRSCAAFEWPRAERQRRSLTSDFRFGRFALHQADGSRHIDHVGQAPFADFEAIRDGPTSALHSLTRLVVQGSETILRT